MKYRNLVSALFVSVLSFLSINVTFAQTSGMPSPIDGQPITDEPNFNLGFGDDDRIPMRSNAFPWSAVGRVQIDDAGHCTGALIGRNLVLTNAHCIFVNGQRRGITFAPNYKNGQSPETVRGAFYWWGTDNPDQNRMADWAIIRLERPIGDRYGWFGWQALDYQQLKGRLVTYAGYSVFGDEKRQEFINGDTAQVHIGCRVRDVFANDGLIHTDCDNGTGGSGGPIFIWQNNRPIIVAINAADYRSPESVQSYFTQNYTPGQGNVGVPTLTFSPTIQQASVANTVISSTDSTRGWSWNGTIASYVTVENGQNFLYVHPFNGQTFGSVISRQVVSSSDAFRGWSWNGTTASYVAFNGEKSILYVRPFDGQSFGSITEQQVFSDTDSIRGWSWDGTTASYVTVQNGRNVLYVRPFNGRSFGSVTSSQTISSTDSTRGWSWDGTTASYVTVNENGGNTVYMRPFNGQTFSF